MLRKALDDAERGQQQQHRQIQQVQTEPLEAPSASETDSLIPRATQDAHYSSTTTTPGDDASDSRSDDDEEGYLLEDWQDDEEGSVVEPPLSFIDRTWAAIKSCFILVVNVENLWDSPSRNEPPAVSRRNHYIVFFWFFILATSYALERSTFKLLVDRSGPFRLFSVEMITCTHALLTGLGMFLSAFSRKDFKIQPLGIPVVDVGCKLMPSFMICLFFGQYLSYKSSSFIASSDGAIGHCPLAISFPYRISCCTDIDGNSCTIYPSTDRAHNAICAFRWLR